MKKQKLLSLVLLFTLLVSAVGYAAVADVSSARADAITTNDANQVVVYSGTGWTYSSGVSGYEFNDYHSSETVGDYVELSWIGNEISIIAATGPDKGEAEIYLDNTLQETVDLYSADLIGGVVIWTLAQQPNVAHTIKMVVAGTKNDLSTGTAVDIDSFRYDNGNSHLPEPPTDKIGVIGTSFGWHAGSDLGSVITCNPDVGGSAVTVTCSGTLHFITAPEQTTQLEGNIGIAITPWHQGYQTLRYSVSVSSTDGVMSCWPYGCGEGQIVNWTTDTFVFVLAQTHGGEASGTFSAIFSFEPLDTCYKNYKYLTTAGPYVIDPTIEIPKGRDAVSPDVPDEQIFGVVPGSHIGIRIAGGPWHDGSLTPYDKYSYSYSWDKITWWGLMSAPCTVTDPVQDYLYTVFLDVPADATNFYIRAKEAEDPPDFSNNTINTDPVPDHPLYYISYVYTQTALDCSSQFSYDKQADWIASVQVDANVPYVDTGAQYTPGDWYVIEVASGSWQDDGAPPDRYDGQYSWGNVMTGAGDDALFYDIGTSATSFCVTNSGNYATIFVQADASTSYNQQGATSSLYLRVKDLAATFSANTGNLGVNIYHATFTRKPNICELQYGIDQLVGHSELGAQQENGVTIGIASAATTQQLTGSYSLVPGAWYMLETTGGPWGWVGDTHSDKSYEAAISWGGQWVNLADWAGSGAGCNVQIDALGHRRVFFQAPTTSGTEYILRVNDTSGWWNNVGSLGVDLYQAHDMHVDPASGQCDYIYDPNQALPFGGDFWVQSTAESGQFGPATLDTNTLYAMEIENSAYSFWKESSSGDALYDMQISDDGGTNWHDLPNGYGGVLCYMQTPSLTILFFQTGDHYLYRLRVASTSFSDNVGSMHIKLYKASPGDTINPWTTGCLNAFGNSGTIYKYALDTSGIHLHIDPQQSEGKLVISDQHWLDDPSILGFAVEVTNGPWHTNDTTPDDRYDAALSKDNGANWQPIGLDNTDIVCADTDALNQYWTAYFKVENGDTWKIRVNDEDAANWANNGGNLWFKVYAIVDQVAPQCVLDTNRNDCLPPGTTIEWGGQDVCTMALAAPTLPTTIDVADWINYASDTVTYGFMGMSQWMSWCPWHTDTLLSLINSFKDKEPWATIQELQQLILESQKQLKAYNWNDSNAPDDILSTSTSSQIMNRLFPPMSSSNPWNGGRLLPNGFASVDVSSYPYYNSCVASSSEFLGNYLPKAICFVSLWWRETTISLWLQIIFDVMLVGAVIRRIRKKSAEIANFMAGGSTVSAPDVVVKVEQASTKYLRYK